MPSDVFNAEAEQYTIAAILRHPESYFEINDVGLVASDFVGRDHKNIFKAILAAVEEKSEPTIPYVVEYLRMDNRDGSVEYVSSLTSIPSSIKQARDYARVVKGLSVNRSLGNAGARIIDIAGENRSDYDSALAEADETLRKVASVLPNTGASPKIGDILRNMSDATSDEKIPIEFAPSLQAVTGGLAKGHFWVAGGFTSTGKSAFACNLLLDVLRHKRSKVAVVSAEMTQEQYAIRLLSIMTGIPQLDIASRVTIGLTNQQKLVDARKELSRMNLFVYDTLYRMPEIRTQMQRLKRQEGLDLMILDYIQNVSITGDEVTDARLIAIELQQMAKDLDCAVLALSQVSNQQAKDDFDSGGDSDYFSFKGHGSIRDASDISIMLRRGRKNQSSALKVDVKKNRHGPLTSFTCDMDLPTGRITEWEWSDEDS